MHAAVLLVVLPLLCCSSVAYTLHGSPPLAVDAISPTFGTVDGGTTLTVVGTGFVNPFSNATCRLWGQNGLVYGEDPHYVKANVTMVTCTTDAFPCVGYVDVDVSMDNTTFSANNVEYHYVQFLDTSPGRSLYTCGGTSGFETTQLEVLLRVDPLLANVAAGDVTPRHPPPHHRRAAGVAGIGWESSRAVTQHDPRSGPAMIVTVAVSAHGQQLLVADVPADGHPHRLVVPQDVATGSTCPYRGALTAHLSCPGCPAVNRTVDFTVLPYKANQVYNDYGTRALVVGGAPFYMYGWITGGTSPADVQLARLRDMAMRGVNTVMTYVCNGRPTTVPPCMNVDEVLGLMDEAQHLGMRVQADVEGAVRLVLKHPNTTAYGYLRDLVTQLKDHPALLGYYITDDTIGQKRDLVADVYDFVHEVDPYHPCLNTISGSGNAWEYQSPRVGFDVGQYEAYDLKDPYYNLVSIPTAWPMAWVAQGLCGQGFAGDSTTQRAARLQAYVNVLGHGTSMVLWEFWQWTSYVSQHVIMSHSVTRQELYNVASAMLSPVLAHPTISIKNTAAPVPGRGGPVIGRAWQRADGAVLVVVANIARSPAPFTLTADFLPTTSGNNTLMVLYEGFDQLVTDNDGTSFTSYLSGFDTRLYLYTPSLPPVASAVSNLVHNPSMEDSEYPGAVNHWLPGFKFVSETYRLGSVALHQDGMTAHTGFHSLRVVAPGSVDVHPGAVLLPIPLSASLDATKSYNWSVAIRVSQPRDANTPFTLSFCSGNLEYPMSPTVYASKALTAADAYLWRTLTWTGAGASGTVGLCVAGTGVVWLDDMMVAESATASVM